MEKGTTVVKDVWVESTLREYVVLHNPGNGSKDVRTTVLMRQDRAGKPYVVEVDGVVHVSVQMLSTLAMILEAVFAQVKDDGDESEL